MKKTIVLLFSLLVVLTACSRLFNITDATTTVATDELTTTPIITTLPSVESTTFFDTTTVPGGIVTTTPNTTTTPDTTTTPEGTLTTAPDTTTVPVVPPTVNIESIRLSAENNQIIIGDTLQINAEILPQNATNKSIIWTLVQGFEIATISDTGLITANGPGQVVVRATASENSLIFGEFTFDINQIPDVLVEKVELSAERDQIFIGDTLQIKALVLPDDALNKAVIWTIVSDGDLADISDDGIITAKAAGVVKVRATAVDNSGKYGEISITISNVLVSSVNITGAKAIKVGDSLTLGATVLPDNAANKAVTWSIVSGSDYATITSDGKLIAKAPGTVKVRATAKDDSEKYGEVTITISKVLVTSVSITGAKDIKVGDSITLAATVVPDNAANKTVTWSISSGSKYATITSDGKLTAIAAGTVKVKASANDGSGKYAEVSIKITNVSVTSVSLSCASNNVYVGDTLKINANILPNNATVKTLTWSISSGSSYASVSSDGVITAKKAGTVKVKATATDGSGKSATITITVSEKPLWDGSGTQNDPFLIRNLTDLKNIEKYLNKSGYYFKQVADIDASSMEAWICLGSEAKPFAHNYDGGNYIISNLHYVSSNDESNNPAGGLFTYAKNSTFRNINIVNASTSTEETCIQALGAIVGTGDNCAFYNCTASVNFKNRGWTGGIVGCTNLDSEQGALMENCHVSGFISGSSGTGGLIGRIGKYMIGAEWASAGEPKATVKNCSSSAEIRIVRNYSDFDDGIGGLIGTANHVRVEKCFATGKVTGWEGYIGGLIGIAEYDCRIAYCYASGDVVCEGDDAYGGAFVGGLVGYMLSYTTVHDCYATGDIYAEKIGWSDCQDTSSYNGGPWLNYRNPCGSLIGCVKNFDDIIIYNNYATGYVYAPKICEDKVFCHGALVGCVYDDYTRRSIIDTSKKDQTDWAGFSEVYTEYFKDNFNLEPLRTYYTPINYFERKSGFPAKYIMPQHEFVKILTDEQFKDQSIFENWDFEKVWIMGENGPQLR